MIDEEQDQIVLIYCPCPDVGEAKRLGHKLLDSGCAGCINILPGMVSLYDWVGVREEAAEAIMIVKTSRAKLTDARDLIAREHPYEVPAVLVLPPVQANRPYAAWLRKNMSAR